MGGDVWLAQAEQGWSYSDGWVCAACVDDDALAETLSAAADPDQACDFCQAAPAADLDVLLEAFFDGLRTEYATASDEGAYFEGTRRCPLLGWAGPRR
ncbi:MAG: hypothetical protein QOF84_6936 [Streptomyces sp.]|nr:hypothetical protein [Streptomyces sp.]